MDRSGTLTDLDVWVDVLHPFVGELRFALKNVSADQSAVIIDRPGKPLDAPGSGPGCSGADYDVVVNDEGPDGDIENQCDDHPAISGNRIGGDPPGQMLAAFDGLEVQGDWMLMVADNRPFRFDGELRQWCLLINGGDEDADLVADAEDHCPDTRMPENPIPTKELGPNRWALMDDDTLFDTAVPNGQQQSPRHRFSLADTAGCSCEQIIDAMGLGHGHEKFGCSTGAVEDWIEWINSGD